MSEPNQLHDPHDQPTRPESEATTILPAPPSGEGRKPAPLPVLEGYTIVRELGAGGMGSVYEAIELKMNRRVALKVLSRHLLGSEGAHQRFLREAWVAGRLNHPNLVKVFERGESGDLSFFSMELADGGSLHDVVRNLRSTGADERWGLKAGTREYITWAMTHVVAAARGLDHAHRHGVVHRDIKPMNLLLSADPVTVKVADFGLALDADAMRLTRTGGVMGTLAYMSPEQIRGQTHDIDARSDVYALGVTLFEMLTLQLPYEGNTQEMYMSAVLTTQARSASRLNERLSRDLDVVLGKALEKSQRDRYQTAAEFAADLDNILSFRPIRAKPPSQATRLWKWAQRRPVHASLAGLLIVTVPTVGLLTTRAVRQQRELHRVQLDRLWERARVLSRENRPAEALAPLNELITAEPDNVEYLRTRALNHLRLAGRQGSIHQEAMTAGMADIDRVIQLLPAESWPYRVRAFMLRRAGRDADAERDESAAGQRRADRPTPTEFEIEGMLAIQARDYQAAVRHFTEAIRRSPGLNEPYLQRALAFERLGQVSRAVGDYQTAAALMPDAATPRYNLGHLAAAAGDLQGAAAYYEEALRLDPKEANVHAGLADLSIRIGKDKATRGDTAGAREEFRKAQGEARTALGLEPTLSWAHLNLGSALTEEERLADAPDRTRMSQALEQYQEVITLKEAEGASPTEEDFAAAVVNLCDGLIQIGDLERALPACRKATDLYPDQADVFYNLAGVLALKGHAAEALAALERDYELGDRDHAYLSQDAWFQALHADTRFQSLLDRMKKNPPPTTGS